MRQPYERTEKPNGSILVRVVVGYRGKTPVRVSKTFPKGTRQPILDSWAEEQKALAGYSPKKKGRPVSPERIIQEWLEEKQRHVAERTYETYSAFAKHYLSGLKALDRTSIADHFAQLRKEDGSSLATQTLLKARAMLSSILDYALENELIDAKPKLPKVRNAHREKRIRALSEDDYFRLMRHLLEREEVELVTLLATGLRVSELLALEPQHASGPIRVEQATLTRWGSRDVGPPKSAHSYRTIDVSSDVILLIMKRVKAMPRGERFVFQIGPSGLAKRLKKACSELGLPPLSLHDLRHSHCTFLLSRGDVPLPAISRRMGHHSPEFTLRRYSHLVPGMDAQVARAIRQHRVA